MKYLVPFCLLLMFSCSSETENPIDTNPDPDPDPIVTFHGVPGDFASIQEAIDNAISGDTIVVQPGEYFENINMKGKSVLLTSLYYESLDVSFIKSTIINGSQGSATNGSVVLCEGNERANCIIQGFTITGGTGTVYTSNTTGNVTRRGGGVMIRSRSSPTITFNIIEGNESTNTEGANSYAGGGGVGIEESSAQIRNNIIRNNEANFGGGVFLDQTACMFSNNVVNNNYALRADFAGGGGLYLDFAFENNNGNKIINNTIVNNRSEGRSDGLTLAGNTVFDNLAFENNIIYGHESEAVIFRAGADSADFNPNYSLIEGGWSQGIDNLDANPELSEEAFLLLENSPCIDSGNPDSSYNDSGSVTLGSERNDMGAYGGPLSNSIL